MNTFASSSRSPGRVRQNNEIAALRALYHLGSLSRAQLAREMGLNRSSSGDIIAQLIGEGLVRQTEDAGGKLSPQPKAGRPGILLEIVPEAAYFVGVEIGVEHITTTVIDLAANVLLCQVKPFRGPSTDLVSALDQAISQAFKDMTQDMIDRCEGIGFSAPVQMDIQGRIRSAPLLGWENMELAEIARASLPFSVPVKVENDANAFAIGEGYKRPEGQTGVTLFLVLESGVGGGILIDGILFRGGHGLAGEIGHILVPDSGGHEVETLIGLNGILTQYGERIGRQHVELPEFLQDVKDRVPHAVAVADDWARYLGFVLRQASCLIDPNRIVLGGSVAALYPMVKARVASYTQTGAATQFALPEIILHEEAISGSAFGAACMMHQGFLSIDHARFGIGNGNPDS